MTAFYVLGGVLAGWALVVTALGITRPGFPGSQAGKRIVIAISVVLVAAAIGSGIVGAASEEEDDEAAAAEAAPAAEGSAAGALAIRADPQALAFDTDELEAEAGSVTIEMENPSAVPHNIAIEGDGVEEEGEVVEQGGVSRVSAELEPGEYTFYCSVPGHREAGMEGTLVVR